MTRWGLVSTILAPAPEILRFAAYHLEAGAHRLYIYLDDENPDAFEALKAHPKCRVQVCDAAYWKKRGGRPERHQVRQTKNASHAYRRKADVDWLGHIDVDEFLVGPVTDALASLPEDSRVARVRPMELLADGDGTAYKGFLPPGPQRRALVQELFPTFGQYLRGGFLSHVSGKIFVRVGLKGVSIRIHKAFEGETEIPGAIELGNLSLAHRHAQSWGTWKARYRYRLEHGAYRAELDKGRTEKPHTMSLHDLFTFLEESEGEDGLRKFHQEVAADTPEMRERLRQRNLLRIVNLDLEHLVKKHF